jgi:hypothetical protein
MVTLTGETPAAVGCYVQAQPIPVAFCREGILINGHPVGRMLRPVNATLGAVYDGLVLAGEIATVALVVTQLLRAMR